MRGVHDLGGVEGHGPVAVEDGEPVFHAPWEERVFRLALASFGCFAGGEFRHAIERMDPIAYLQSSYYDHWLTALETLMTEKGHVDAAQLSAQGGGSPHRANPVHPEAAPPQPVVPEGAPPRFHGGDAVAVRRHSHHGHSRCPGYLLGVEGRVVRRVHATTLDDGAAHGAPRKETVYLVRFQSAEIWGPPCETHEVLAELWESHLDAVAAA
jgi:nitrile hydratase